MKVAFKEPGKAWRRMVISNELSVLQQMVGGYIEIVPLGDRRDCAIICDEEGKLKGKERNAIIAGHEFVGNIIMIGLDEEGELCDIRESYADILAGEMGAI